MRRLLLATASTVLLGACVAGPAPDVATPAPSLPQSFLYAPASGEAEALASLLPETDGAFRALADSALSSSPSLAEALARIDAARASAAGAGAARLPSVSADGSVSATRINPAQFGGDLPGGIAFDTDQIAYGANLGARWDADLFGALRASEQAAMARIDAADAGARAVRLALIAEIATSTIDWRTLAAREAALEQDLTAAQRLAGLTGARERAGLSPGFDRVRADAAASASASRVAALASERVRIVGRLVTLTGQSGQQVLAMLALDGGDAVLNAGAAAAPAALPSQLLANRPDVSAAQAELAAADAELAAAARARFPQLTLSAALGLLAFNPADLFDEDALVYTLASGLTAPLFDGGRIQAGIDGAAAGKRLAYEAWRGAVYAALGEAEAGYGLVSAADIEAATAAAERDQLERAARLADTRYRAGLADFLTVLEARRSADASGDRAAAAQGRALRARVLLWQALGGDASQQNGGA